MRYRGILTSKQTRGQHEIGPSGGLGAVPNLWLPQLRALVAFSFTQGLAVRFRLHGMQYLERAGHGAGTARQLDRYVGLERRDNLTVRRVIFLKAQKPTVRSSRRVARAARSKMLPARSFRVGGY